MDKPNQRRMIYCEPCGFRQIIEESDITNMIQVKTAPIQKNIPQLDKATNKTAVVKNPKTAVPQFTQVGPEKIAKQLVTSVFVNQPVKVKCPKCGRAIIVRGLLQPFAKAYEEIEKKELEAKKQADLKQRIEDGKPLDKKPEDIIPPKKKPEPEPTPPPADLPVDIQFNG